MAVELDALKAEVAEAKRIMDKAIVVINDINAKLAGYVNPADLPPVVADLKASTDALKAIVEPV